MSAKFIKRKYTNISILFKSDLVAENCPRLIEIGLEDQQYYDSRGRVEYFGWNVIHKPEVTIHGTCIYL